MHQPDTPIEAHGDGCRLYLYARPRAGRTEIAGLHDGRIKLKIAAPPVDGAANDAIVGFLSSQLGVRKSDIEFVSGHTGKRKTVQVHGLGPDQAREKLGL